MNRFGKGGRERKRKRERERERTIVVVACGSGDWRLVEEQWRFSEERELGRKKNEEGEES